MSFLESPQPNHTPEKPKEKPTPITFKFTVRGDDWFDIESQARIIAQEFYGDVEFKMHMEAHLSPPNSAPTYTAHVEAIRKINYNEYE